MRFALIAVLAVPTLFAQRSVSPSGFGRVVFPGGQPTNTAPTGRILFPGGGAPAVTRTQAPGGIPVYASAPLNPPRVDHNRHGGQSIVPFPIFYGGGYAQYDPPPAQIVNVNVQPGYLGPQPYYPREQEASPVVIINQYFRGEEAPVTQTATAPQAAVTGSAPLVEVNQNDDATVFLIAMKDHNVYVAKAYWIEEGALHYISTQGVESTVAMTDVDRDLSRRMNRERNVAFGLPAN